MSKFRYIFPLTSRLKSLTYPTSTGLVSNLSYFPNTSPVGTGNGDQRLQQISNVVGTTNISNFAYTYNPVGTIATWQQQADANQATQYALTYDAADQLINAVNTNTSTHAVVNSNAYQFDLMGNRLVETTQSATNVGQFNMLNQLKAYTGSTTTQTVSGHTSTPIISSAVDDTVPVTISNGTNFTANVPVANGTNVVTIQAKNAAGTSGSQKVQFVTSGGNTPVKLSHDLNGNVKQDETGNIYTWDALNRLISITYPSGSSSTFGYDGGSRRISIVEKNSSGAVTSTKLYLWIGNSIADERNSTNVVQKRFYPQGEQQAGTPYFYTRDHLGSVRELISATGTTISRLSYNIFGVTTVVSGTILPTFQYAGYCNHATSGLYLTTYRAFNTVTGRWLSRDPIGEAGGLNVYAYTGNNPLSLIDPLGLTSIGLYDSYSADTHAIKEDLANQSMGSAQGDEFAAAANHYDGQNVVDTSGKTPDQIADAVDQLIAKKHLTDITEIDVWDHGMPGDQMLNDKFSVAPTPAFKRITDHLAPNGILSLHGCEVAKDDSGDYGAKQNGVQYIEDLAQYFGHEVDADTLKRGIDQATGEQNDFKSNWYALPGTDGPSDHYRGNH